MSRTLYHDFLDMARAEYDLDYQGAQELYREYRDEFDLDTSGAFELLLDVSVIAEEPEEPVEEEREPGLYFDEEVDESEEWDVEDISDYWVDAGEELEIVVYYEEN